LPRSLGLTQTETFRTSDFLPSSTSTVRERNNTQLAWSHPLEKNFLFQLWTLSQVTVSQRSSNPRKQWNSTLQNLIPTPWPSSQNAVVWPSSTLLLPLAIVDPTGIVLDACTHKTSMCRNGSFQAHTCSHQRHSVRCHGQRVLRSRDGPLSRYEACLGPPRCSTTLLSIRCSCLAPLFG